MLLSTLRLCSFRSLDKLGTGKVKAGRAGNLGPGKCGKSDLSPFDAQLLAQDRLSSSLDAFHLLGILSLSKDKVRKGKAFIVTNYSLT